jgi:tetratricopeptide (TPR) repeat protein
MKSLCLRFLMLVLVCSVHTAHAAETRGLRVVAKDPATNQTGEVQLYNKSYAVIIGIDRYQNLPPDRQLAYAVKDAEGVLSTLKKHYKFDRIATLYNHEATKERIMKLLTSDLPRDMGPDDAVFLFWAGHGNQESSADGEIGYLIPYDGSADEIYKNITMTEIRDTVSKKLPAKHVFYAFDACYSGLLATRAVDTKSRRDLAYMKEITKERVRQVLTAGSKGQEVLDGGRNGHSVFTGRLIEILEVSGDYITANEIQSIIKEKVYGDAIGRGLNQKPDFGRLSGTGDFVFIPNIEQKVQDNKAEVAKMEAELKRYEAQEAEARKHQSEQQQREAEQRRKAAEARLRVEQMKQQQLVAEQKRLVEEEQARARFETEQKQKEKELTAAQRAEEQRINVLKAEVEKRKQAVGTAAIGSITILAAVDEIRRLNSQIDGIAATFSNELNEGRQRIAGRYDIEISRLKQDEGGKKQSLQKDEFETEAEYRQRVGSQTRGYSTRVSELETNKQEELNNLEKRLKGEQETQIATLRDTLRQLSEKEYPLPAELMTFELGQYDLDKQAFPVNITSKPTSPFRVAVIGTIPLPRDAAREFKQQFTGGLVRQNIIAKADGELKRVTIINDTDNLKLDYVGGEFLTVKEQKQKVESLLDEATDAASEKALKIMTDVVWLYPDNAENHDILGRAYSANRKYDEAFASIQQALQIKSRKFGADSIEAAASYLGLAKVHIGKEKYDEALKYANKSLEIREKLMGEQHKDVAESLTVIGDIKVNKGEYSEAVKGYRKALEIRKAALGPDHKDVGESYGCLAAGYYYTNDYDDAVSNARMELDIYRKSLTDRHPKVATSYNNLGAFYFGKGDYDSSLSNYFKATAIKESVFGADSPELARSYNNIGATYKAKRDIKNALEYYNKALVIQERMLGKKHTSTATTYSNIGSAFYYKNDKKQAKHYFKLAYEIQREILGSDHPNTKFTVDAISKCN